MQPAKCLICSSVAPQYRELLCDDCFDEQKAVQHYQYWHGPSQWGGMNQQKSTTRDGQGNPRYKQEEFQLLLTLHGSIAFQVMPMDRKESIADAFWQQLDYTHWASQGQLIPNLSEDD